MKKWKFVLAIAFLPLLAEAGSSKGGLSAPPDLTKGDFTPSSRMHDWNLGPTGARGWIYCSKFDTTEARQIYVTKVDRGSPSDSVLNEGDVILGVFGENFSYDPRTEFGKAITKAEATDGKLKLTVWRDDKISEKVVTLMVLGSYSETAPFECSKSRVIFENGCKVLAEQLGSDAIRRNPITACYGAMALLASGKKKYYPVIKKVIRQYSSYSDPEQRSLHSWYYGPINILLAEYTMASGDKTFMPDLQRITMEIVDGRSFIGSWGHRFVASNGRLQGYGMMNVTSLPLTTSLILARKAGVEYPELNTAIKQYSRLARFYMGKGSIPYGDHTPWTETHDDNGKNGIAAVMFNLLGDEEAARYFSRMSVASHGAERDSGHTGNYFNMQWAMPGVALSGPNATGAWMKEFGWYYDLARKWDGTFIHQGAPEEYPDNYNRWDATGAYLLAYAQPFKKVYLTGKQGGVLNAVSKSAAQSLIAEGRGWNRRTKHTAYTKRTDDELLNALRSWSPTVRERAAFEEGRRKSISVAQLIEMLENGDLYAQQGACMALGQRRSDAAVEPLLSVLNSKDLWLRVKAAEALAAIGRPAKRAIPALLERLVCVSPEADPRMMEQRFLCFALFNKRGGLLRTGLDGIDRTLLANAIEAGLKNEDGRARGSVATAYEHLTFDELKPLLPVIYQAIAEPAPSGIMFSSEVRMAGLKLFAEHRIEQGMQLIADYIKNQRKHASEHRVPTLLTYLEPYGAHAQEIIPQLNSIAEEFKNGEYDFPKRLSLDKAEHIVNAINKIKKSTDKPVLKQLKL